MGKAKKQDNTGTGFEKVGPTVARPTEVTPLPPQPDNLLSGQALLGTVVRASVGGHMETIMLTEYDETSDCHHGVVISGHREASSQSVPYFAAVHNLRPWPQPQRGGRDLDFQWVRPGRDESPLVNIAQANAVRKPE